MCIYGMDTQTPYHHTKFRHRLYEINAERGSYPVIMGFEGFFWLVHMAGVDTIQITSIPWCRFTVDFKAIV